MKDKIACFIRTYLFPTETFIYEAIRNIKNFTVVVLACNLINTHLFPYHEIISPPRVSKQLPFFGKLLERIFFARVIKKKSVKLIHAWYGWSGIMILPVCKKLGLPLITSFHGLDVSRLPRHFFYRRKLFSLFKRGDLFLTRSFFMRDEVIRLGCPPEKVLVHYGGINVSRFKLKEKTRAREIKILMCGRMVEKKGFNYGILAFSRISRKYPRARMIIVGDGKLRQPLEKLVLSFNLQDKVEFSGFLPHHEVEKKMREADIFLAPSVTARNQDKEGIPNVIKEAMACGLPVVSTYHAGIPEIVRDGETGFLVPERDVNLLAERLDYLLSHPEIWTEIGMKARELIWRKFNLFTQTQELEKIYSRFIK